MTFLTITEWNQNLESRVEEQTRELKEAYDNLTRTQDQLLQSEKMAAIGQLAAGVAHEINNPVAFVSSNLNTFGEYLQDLQDFLGETDQSMDSLRQTGEANVKSFVSSIDQLKDKLDIDFVMEDLTDIVQESKSFFPTLSSAVRNDT